MRVMLDSAVWVALGDDDLLENFRRVYNEKELDVIFSIGNFLDLIRSDNQDELSHIIDEFADEYLAPLQLDLEGDYRYASNPLVLATVDAEWYEQCRQETKGLDDLETLKALFQDAEFKDGPVLTRVSQFVDEYRQIDEADLDVLMKDPGDESRSVAIKKIRTFPSYTQRRDDGGVELDDESIPTKRYVVGMSMIYVSETRKEPQPDDYRDAMIWSQAIIAGCDVLWTDQQWEYDHPIIARTAEKLDRDELEIASDFEAFETALD